MARDARVLEQFVLRPDVPSWVRMRRWLTSFARHKPLGTACALIVVLLIAMALAPGVFARGTDPNAGILGDRLIGPSGAHWFGTDQNGRDVFARIVYGARTSVLIGFGVVGVATAIATVLGILSGYLGGWVDTAVQRLVDIGIALPGLVFVILFVTSLQQFPVTLDIIVSVGLLIAVGSSRIIRGAAIAAKENQYVEAARVLGASDIRIVFRHVLPNVFAIIMVSASIQIGGAILIESALSFLGYGVQPPVASWGRMLSDAQLQISNHFYLAVFPGLAIFITVYSFNMLGDALRDVLDPRLRGSR